jgi:hypothetical protein
MYTKVISICVKQTHPMPVRIQNVSQQVLSKHIPMPARAQNATQTCVYQTHTKPARTQNVS